jgi:hypothetical protein
MNKIVSNEFHVTFALSKTKMFSVSYYTLGDNQSPYFSTTAEVFNRPKTDYNQCGQCQETVLKGYKVAMDFYKKWDNEHLKQLDTDKYAELLNDLDVLFNKYPYILHEKDNNRLKDIRFSEVKDFSMSVYR